MNLTPNQIADRVAQQWKSIKDLDSSDLPSLNDLIASAIEDYAEEVYNLPRHSVLNKAASDYVHQIHGEGHEWSPIQTRCYCDFIAGCIWQNLQGKTISIPENETVKSA